MKNRVWGLVASGLFLASSAFAQIASDVASNYGGGNPWTNGSTGGTGFSTWTLANNNNINTGIFAGNFIGDSTAGGSGNINTGGVSFGMFANPNTAFSTADRSFSEGSLLAGQTFSLQMAVNFRNGAKGFNLDNGNTQLFNFNVGGNDYTYKIGNNAPISLNLTYEADSVFTLSFTPTTGTLFNVKIIRTTTELGTESTNLNGVDLGNSANHFQFYISNTNGGEDGAADNLYFNNLAITVPEPGVLSLFTASGCLAGLLFRRRKGS